MLNLTFPYPLHAFKSVVSLQADAFEGALNDAAGLFSKKQQDCAAAVVAVVRLQPRLDHNQSWADITRNRHKTPTHHSSTEFPHNWRQQILV